MVPEKSAEFRELVRKTALLNAVRHAGKAQSGPIVGKILGENPDYRTRIDEISVIINDVVQEVNRLSLDAQMQIIAGNWPEALAKTKVGEDKHLPPLPNVACYKQVVTRFSPNPDCVLHLGSARAIVLCYEYARIYKGKFILRFEDTDPKLKKPVLEFYDRIREDLVWLGCKPDEEYVQSDRIPIYYEYTERLLKEGNAYVCLCSPEQSHKRILVSESCECRNCAPEEHLARWQSMLEGSYGEGEAVVRVKTDLNHPNPAVREWPALRIIDTEKHPHPRVGSKYKVWPLYNLACGIDDHLMGITHIIRGKEHLTNQVRQEYMYQYLDWKYPEAIHYGRLKITGAYLSKSKIVQGVRDGLFKDWADPRLATFTALRKRGIMPDAIKKMIIDIGPKTSDVVLSWENLYAYDRKILDPVADRYFFIQNPTELMIRQIPKEFNVKLHFHPTKHERGQREYVIQPKGDDSSAKFWIEKKDIIASRTGTILRLMELFNIRIESINSHMVEASFASESYEEARVLKAQLIHWIPVGEGMPCQVIMPDATVAEGVAESTCKRLKPNDIIQFERFGFVRIDNVGDKLTACFAHR